MYFFSVPGVLVSFLHLLILRSLVIPNCFFCFVYLNILLLILLVIIFISPWGECLSKTVFRSSQGRDKVCVSTTLPRTHLWGVILGLLLLLLLFLHTRQTLKTKRALKSFSILGLPTVSSQIYTLALFMLNVSPSKERQQQYLLYVKQEFESPCDTIRFLAAIFTKKIHYWNMTFQVLLKIPLFFFFSHWIESFIIHNCVRVYLLNVHICKLCLNLKEEFQQCSLDFMNVRNLQTLVWKTSS